MACRSCDLKRIYKLFETSRVISADKLRRYILFKSVRYGIYGNKTDFYAIYIRNMRFIVKCADVCNTAVFNALYGGFKPTQSRVTVMVI